MRNNNIYQNLGPFVKYCLVGVIGTALDLGSLYMFVEYFGIQVLLATTMSFLLAVVNNFILNKFWTFENKSDNYRRQFIKFLMVSLVGLGFTVSLMHIFVFVIGAWYMLAKAITSLLVLIWNFLANRYWTFSLKEREVFIPDKFEFDLSIVIPAYNEENRIKATLSVIRDYIEEKGVRAEILVVNDGSSDNTANIVENYAKKIPTLRLINFDKNNGKGFAVKAGVESSLGKQILFTDADNSTPIEEYEKLEKALLKNKADLAIGSRYMQKSNIKIRQPLYRVILGRVGNTLIRLFLLDGIRDTQCGFKLFEHKIAKEIFSFQKVKRFGFDMEALVVAQYLGYKTVEVPVSWFNSAESRFRPLKDSVKTLIDLVYIKLNMWAGRYSGD